MERAGPVWYGDETDATRTRRAPCVGYVAQGFSLYPRMSVWRHMTFAGATPELSAYWIEHLRLQGLETDSPQICPGASVNEWVWPGALLLAQSAVARRAVLSPRRTGTT